MIEGMEITPTEHCYIVRKADILSGEPVVKGTRTPVRAIVELWWLGYPLDQILSALPHLSLAAVFDALSYYSDHQEEINEYIELNRVSPDLFHPSVQDG
jgi:uncharacterized protein (DUF433 family)